MHLPDLEKQTAMKTLPSLTVPIVVLLSLCSAWILLCCHVESLDLGRKCNHGHVNPPIWLVGTSPRSRQHVILVRFYGAVSPSHTYNDGSSDDDDDDVVRSWQYLVWATTSTCIS